MRESLPCPFPCASNSAIEMRGDLKNLQASFPKEAAVSRIPMFSGGSSGFCRADREDSPCPLLISETLPSVGHAAADDCKELKPARRDSPTPFQDVKRMTSTIGVTLTRVSLPVQSTRRRGDGCVQRDDGDLGPNPDPVNTCVNIFRRRKAKKEPPGLANLSGVSRLHGRR